MSNRIIINGQVIHLIALEGTTVLRASSPIRCPMCERYRSFFYHLQMEIGEPSVLICSETCHTHLRTQLASHFGDHFLIRGIEVPLPIGDQSFETKMSRRGSIKKIRPCVTLSAYSTHHFPNPVMELTYFAYCRAAAPQVTHHSHSLEGQKQALDDFAAQGGISIRHIFTEAASTNHHGGRPIFLDMLRRLERGEANAVLACDLSRLTRNYPDGMYLANMLYRGILKEIRTPTKTFTSGFDLNLSLTLQQFERQQLSENIKRGLCVRKMRNHEL